MHLVLGIGNRLVPRDSLGSEIVARLEPLSNDQVTFIDCQETPENFISKFIGEKIERLVIVDVGKIEGNKDSKDTILLNLKPSDSLDEYLLPSTHKTKVSTLLKLLNPSQAFLVLPAPGLEPTKARKEVLAALQDILKLNLINV